MTALQPGPELTARAFGERLEPLLSPLLQYFLRRVEPSDDAYDCVSETLVVAWRRHRSAPTTHHELRAWSFGIARHVLANQRRSRRRHTRLLSKAMDDARISSAPRASDTGVADALAHLSVTDRELVLLIVWDGFGVAEAGAIVGLRPEAARTRYSRARARLRQALTS